MNVRGITVAVDTTYRDQRSLRDATRIAARLKAEVTAMFVTSANLQRFACLPTATEVSMRSARTRRLDPGNLSADLDRVVDSITRELRNLAYELDVTWRVISTPLEKLSEYPSTDLLLVDRRAGHTPVSRSELGSVAAKLVTECRQSVLLFEGALALDKPVGVLVDANYSGPLDLALTFARASGRLLVLIDARDRESFERARERLRAAIASHDVALETDWIRAPRSPLLSSHLHSRKSGLFVVDAASSLLQHEGLPNLLNALKIPVLLTRQ